MDPLRQSKELADSLGYPCYFVSGTDWFQQLSAAERKLVFANPDNLAFTSPTCDLLFKNSALRYEWRGRGPCIVFATSPLAISPSQRLAVTVHELGHYAEYCDNPSRDDSDHERALQAAWSNLRPESEQHNRQWLRATMHLYHRATAMLGYEIPLGEVLCLEQYGFSRRDLAPLLSEASEREAESLEDILRGSAPGNVATSTATKPAPSSAGKRSDPERKARIRALRRNLYGNAGVFA